MTMSEASAQSFLGPIESAESGKKLAIYVGYPAGAVLIAIAIVLLLINFKKKKVQQVGNTLIYDDDPEESYLSTSAEKPKHYLNTALQETQDFEE